MVANTISILRLRFGEPVRFKFIVGKDYRQLFFIHFISSSLGMLLSYNGGAFQVACLRFLNRFVEKSKTVEQRVFIQYELQEAGLNNLELDSLMLKVIVHHCIYKCRKPISVWSRK